ncbi:MAG TPA: acetyl-CoA C-acyltransferase [Planctomycetota bacterium]|nr:acetyl-CoA C-acyltransferase [Planctomycetota bacterium]
MSARIVIAAGWRTPQAKAGGAFAREDAGHLGAAICRETLARSGLDPAELDEVIVGCVGQPHDQANVARVIAIRAGVPQHVPARTVARNCASGLEAVTSAATAIEAGRGELYLCAGVEVMSRYPLTYGPEMTQLFADLAKARTPVARVAVLARFRPRFLKPVVSLMEGLTDPTCGLIMGRTAEILAREWGISREQSDRFAVESHNRAEAARDAGRFAREIVPHLPLGAPEGSRALEHDDGIREAQTLEGMAKLKPFFEKPDGQVTVGNSCGITDGATALIVTTEARARALGLAPLAALRSWAWAGLDPARMGLGPVYASSKALAAAGVELSDIGPIEVNEAFAAQVLACAKAFESDAFAREQLGRERALGTLDVTRTNVNGGAIALGHPVGATGARLLLTTAHQMAIADAELGLATLCIGGGQGGAAVLERVV